MTTSLIDTDMSFDPASYTGSFAYPPAFAIALAVGSLTSSPTPPFAMQSVPVEVRYTEIGAEISHPLVIHDDLTPRETTDAEMLAWGRSMAGRSSR